MPSREEHDRGEAHPTDDEGNHNVEENDTHSVSSSEAADREAAKDVPGVDMRAAPREHGGFYVMIFFTVFSFISFIFMLTSSTTISWYKAGNGDKWSLWRNKDGQTWRSNPCQHKAQMFQAMQAFTIVGCIFSLATFVAGLLQTIGSGHMGMSLLLCAVTMTVNLVAWALGVNQYHKYNCPGEISFVNKVNRLEAGFALTFISFTLMLFGFLTLLYYFYTYYSWTPKAKSDMNGATLTCALLTSGCLIITCVGNAFTLWEDYSTTHKLKITMWHVEILSQSTGLSEYYTYKNYHCSALNKMFSAGQAFGIISAVFLFIATLLTWAAVFSRPCKWAAFGAGLASWVFLLIDWAILVAMRYKTFCKDGTVAPAVHGLSPIPMNQGEQEVSFTGFFITEGLGMIISAWCAMTLIVVYLVVKG